MVRSLPSTAYPLTGSSDGSSRLDAPTVLVRGPSVRLSSSTGLGWSDLTVERHRVAPGDKVETAISDVVICLASGSHASYGERRNARGVWMPYSREPGSVFVFGEGSLPPFRNSVEEELTVSFVGRSFVDGIIEEAGGNVLTRNRSDGVPEDPIVRLVLLLEAEAASGGLSGRLYMDHLAHALVLRLLSPPARRQEDRSASSSMLSRPRLRRVLERIDSALHTDLDLKTLAAETSYSRNHFIRMFRASTGYTPHQYVLHRRVQTAQAMLRDRSKQLIEIALACGFSSHAHFSRMFRQVMGVTPSEYRRNL